MIIKNSEALRSWLISSLGGICNADTAAVAKYVLALVKKDRSEEDLYEFCLEQLDAFLSEDTKHFVEQLFDTLSTKSYLLQPNSEAVAVSKSEPSLCEGATISSAAITSKKEQVDKQRKMSSDIKCKRFASLEQTKTRKQDSGKMHSKKAEKTCTASDKSLKKLENELMAYHIRGEKSKTFPKEKEELKKIEKHPVKCGNSDSKPKETHLVSKNTTYLLNENITEKGSKRCQDYHGGEKRKTFPKEKEELKKIEKHPVKWGNSDWKPKETHLVLKNTTCLFNENITEKSSKRCQDYHGGEESKTFWKEKEELKKIEKRPVKWGNSDWKPKETHLVSKNATCLLNENITEKSSKRCHYHGGKKCKTFQKEKEEMKKIEKRPVRCDDDSDWEPKKMDSIFKNTTYLLNKSSTEKSSKRCQDYHGEKKSKSIWKEKDEIEKIEKYALERGDSYYKSKDIYSISKDAASLLNKNISAKRSKRCHDYHGEEKSKTSRKPKERIRKTEKRPVECDDSDWVPRKKHSTSKSTTYLLNKNATDKSSKRCQDYHEKGYCMRGDLCHLDHGADPVVVADVSQLNFGVPSANVISSDTNVLKNLVPDSFVKNVYNSQVLPPLPPPCHPLEQPPLPSSPSPTAPPAPPSLFSYLAPHIISFLSKPPPPLPTSQPPSLSCALTTPPNPASDLLNKRIPVHEEPTSTDMHPTAHSKKRKTFDYNPFEPKPKRVSSESRYTPEVSIIKHVKNVVSLESRYTPEVCIIKHVKNVSSLNDKFSKHGQMTNFQPNYKDLFKSKPSLYKSSAESSAAIVSKERNAEKRRKISSDETSKYFSSSKETKARRRDKEHMCSKKSENKSSAIDKNFKKLENQLMAYHIRGEKSKTFQKEKEEMKRVEKRPVEFGDSDRKIRERQSVSKSTTCLNKNVSGKSSRRCQDYHGTSSGTNTLRKNLVPDPFMKNVYNSQVLPSLSPPSHPLEQPPLPSSPPALAPPPPLPSSRVSVPQPCSSLTVAPPPSTHAASNLWNQTLPKLKEPTRSVIRATTSSKKRKGFDYNRLGTKRVSLESRYTPEVSIIKHVKNVSSLNDQVSKCGQMTNLQTLNKRLELHKKEQEVLESQIQNQKSFVVELSKAKSKKTKSFLKKAIQDLATKITALEVDAKKRSEELMKCIRSYNVPSKWEGKKQLLDIEMDLYKKQHKGQDTAELISRVGKLKQQVKKLDLFAPSTSRKVVSSTKPREGQLVHDHSTKIPVSKPVSTLPKTGKNPKIPIALQEKDAPQKHLLQIDEIKETVDEKETGTISISQKAAEKALLHEKTLETEIICLSPLQGDGHGASEADKDVEIDKGNKALLHEKTLETEIICLSPLQGDEHGASEADKVVEIDKGNKTLLHEEQLGNENVCLPSFEGDQPGASDVNEDGKADKENKALLHEEPLENENVSLSSFEGDQHGASKSSKDGESDKEDKASLHEKHLGNENLCLSSFQGDEHCASESNKADKADRENEDVLLLQDDDDEEEEDSEPRSWRR